MSDGQTPAIAGFRVRIAYADGTVIEDSDGWLSWSAEEESMDSCDSTARKIPGGRKYSNITLKRGADTSRSMYEWWSKVETHGTDALAEGTIEVLDYKQQPVHVYAFKQGWPTKWVGASLNAQSNEVAIESVTISAERVDLS